MKRCHACHGFIPTAQACPNCVAGPTARSTWLKDVTAVAGGAALSVSLAACYGAPIYEPQPAPNSLPFASGYNSSTWHNADPNDANSPPAGTEERTLHHHDAKGEIAPGLDPHDPEALPCDCGGEPP